jgi:hypothetical protein
MSSMLLRAFVAVSLVFVSFASVATAQKKPDTQDLAVKPVTVTAKPISAFRRIDFSQTRFGELTFLGGLVLSSDAAVFGGWSGLVLDDNGKDFLAISDTGVWMTGEIAYSDRRLSGIKNARIGPLLEGGGRPISRPRDRDAESVALLSGTLKRGELLVGFERRARITRYKISAAGVSAPVGELDMPAKARALKRNQGFEALTVMKGGRNKGKVIAIAERYYNRGRNHTGWIWSAGRPQPFYLENIGDFDVTDMANLDDGTVFVLERRFLWLEGVKMRLRRLAPDAIRPGATVTGDILIEADLSREIDNMEGLAVTRRPNGEILITMLSDDNFNRFVQRNLLLQFSLAGDETAKAQLPADRR